MTVPSGTPLDPAHPHHHVTRRAIVTRVAMLVVSATVLYVFLPEMTDMFSKLPELTAVRPRWFVIMLVLETASFACMWALWRVAMPGLAWGLAATTQLSANALSRVIPGGGAVGAATGFKMLATGGVSRSRAAVGLGANSLISTGVLAALPVVAVLFSLVGLRIPESLEIGAWAGAVLFVMLFALGFVLVRYETPPRILGRTLERVLTPLYKRLDRGPAPNAASVVAARDRLLRDLGPRWKRALAAAAGNWLFDYLALVTALVAVGAKPRPSLILLAYAGAAVLAMIPITPGGLGFVEAGLTSMLIAAHINPESALLATLAYRLVSYWLPLLVGLVAYAVFRRRYRGHPDFDSPTAVAV